MPLLDNNGNVVYARYARLVQCPFQPRVFPMSELPRLQAEGIETLIYHGMVYTAGNNPEHPFIGLKKVPHRGETDPEFVPCCYSRQRSAMRFSAVATPVHG